MTIYENIKQLESVGQLHSNTLVNADCLEAMKYIADKSIDMVLCDLPYGQLGTTACSWDIIIPFDKLWEQYNRIIKDNGAIVLFGNEPFSSYLRISNIKYYRYDWIWNKTRAANYVLARKMPLKYSEYIHIFYKKRPIYNAQMILGCKPYIKKAMERYNKDKCILKDTRRAGEISISKGERFPTNIIKFPNDNHKSIHPTQKPVALLEYLIKTYTNEGETVLDNCMGSGSTGVACVNLNRSFIGIEMDDKYFEIASKRINDHIKKINI